MMNILLLEDNTFDTDLVLRTIKKDLPDSNVDTAYTLEQARKLLQKSQNFDIALLDINLPDGSGIDLLLEIRKRKIPIVVIMLTSSHDEELAVTALQSGADDYLQKKEAYLMKLANVIKHNCSKLDQKLEFHSHTYRILYIEHHQSDIDLTIRHFKKYAPQFKIEYSFHGGALHKRLKKDIHEASKFDALLLDYRLPGIDVFDLIKTIRQEWKLDIPIVIVTGQGNEEVAIQSLKLGADEYLVKRDNYLYRLPSLLSSAIQKRILSKQKKELADSESRYRLLAENSGDVIFVLDMDLNYKFISPAVKQIRSFEPEEALKQKLSDVLTPESLKKAQKIFSDLLTNLKSDSLANIPPRNIELEMIRKDGTTLWTEVRVSLLLDESGKPAGLVGLTRDISKRKLITEELRKKARAVEQSPVSIIITDKKGNIEYVNPKFTQITGYSLHEVYGENPRILNSGLIDKLEYKNLWEKILAGKKWAGEFLNKRKDGTLFWESASISPILDDDGVITHFLGVKEDITEKKNFEKELIRSKEKAEESDKLKTAFLQNISHEIRTPMNAIKGFTGLLDGDLDPEKRRYYIELISQSSDHLLDIINDIISIATIEAGQEKINLAAFNLNDIMRLLKDQFELKMKEKGIDFELELGKNSIDFTINSDQTKLKQIFTNLLSNALKFTDKGRVTYGYSLEANSIKFFVKDTGIGIHKEMHEKIFNRFYQVDGSKTRLYEGTGLGLALSKAYVELLNGKIWVESKPGMGAEFIFTIPYLKLEKPETFIETEIDLEDFAFTSMKTILVAEDEDTNYFLLEEYLSTSNVNVLRARNGIEAYEICNADLSIDLVLMDIKMPRMNGYDSTHRIKIDHPNLPVLALTAYTETEDEGKAIAAGCSDYLTKPIKRLELMAALKKHIPKV